MAKRIINKVNQGIPYWSSVCIASSQIFLAISMGAVFAGSIDSNTQLVVEINILITLLCWILGWRFK